MEQCIKKSELSRLLYKFVQDKKSKAERHIALAVARKYDNKKCSKSNKIEIFQIKISVIELLMITK